jgi:hypothetical protein
MFSSQNSQVSNDANYIEDVFSTYLYTGNSSNRSINNGIDLSTKGGMVWFKARNVGSNHYQVDTARGNTKYLASNSTTSQMTFNDALTAFTTTGFNLGVDAAAGDINGSGYEMASWSIAKTPKFFDVVTYTGNGATKTVSHSLTSTPGCIIIKKTSSTSTTVGWFVYHRSLGSNYFLALNLTDAQNGYTNWITCDSTSFTLNVTDSDVNASGSSYVAYLFAHNAGGFGLTGTDNVISCGSYTGNASATGPVIDLGYEPQFVIIKRASNAADWMMHDNMRGLSDTSFAQLRPNLSDAEYTGSPTFLKVTATGFQITTSGTNYNASGNTYIYIAIRRGPMKVPTDATKVFSPTVSSATTGTKVTTGFPIDAQIVDYRTSPTGVFLDRLRGVSSNSTASGQYLKTTTTDAETTVATASLGWDNTGFQINSGWSGANTVYYNFRRAPSFFDEVCYTGDGTADGRTITHNLGVTPQLVIVKRRSSTANWLVTFNTSHVVLLNSTNADVGYADATGNYANGLLIGTNATTLTEYSGATDNSAVNASGSTYVAYLFATCAGVSKVGSYTGTGTTLQVNCGFTAGARFVLIKKTSGTGSWYVWDSARGIVSGNDPYLLLNSTAAEVTNTDYIDTYSAGFEISSTAPSEINENGGSFIFFAVA